MIPPTTNIDWQMAPLDFPTQDIRYIYNVKVEQYVVSTLNIIWSRYVGTYCELFLKYEHFIEQQQTTIKITGTLDIREGAMHCKSNKNITKNKRKLLVDWWNKWRGKTITYPIRTSSVGIITNNKLTKPSPRMNSNIIYRQKWRTTDVRNKPASSI